MDINFSEPDSSFYFDLTELGSNEIHSTLTKEASEIIMRIGSVAVSFSRLERELFNLILLENHGWDSEYVVQNAADEVYKIDPKFRIFQHKIKQIHRFLNRKSIVDSNISDCLEYCMELNEIRNRIIHSVFLLTYGDYIVESPDIFSKGRYQKYALGKNMKGERGFRLQYPEVSEFDKLIENFGYTCTYVRKISIMISPAMKGEGVFSSMHEEFHPREMNLWSSEYTAK